MNTNETVTAQGYDVGTTHVLNVPPGWLLAGTIAEVTKEELVLRDSIYIEGIGDGHSALSSVSSAVSAKDLKSAVTKCYPVRDGMRLRRDAVLISVPCVRDMTPLSRGDDANAIKKAAGK
jgi:hypothetical protein